MSADRASKKAATKQRTGTVESVLTEVTEALGEAWPPRLYRERILLLRTRAHPLPAPASTGGRAAQVEVQHTLLGVELKVGRRRISCPDLATARYLAVFARMGVGAVAVPYDITKISPLADELESGWQRMLLLVGHVAVDRSEAFRGRVRRALVEKIRREIEEAGAGTAVPQFNQNTRQRRQRV